MGAVVAENHRVPRCLIRAAVIGLLIATPVATWWHIGPLGAAEGSTITAAVRFRPPALSEATKTTLGRLASALVAASTVALTVAARRGVVDRRGWQNLDAAAAPRCFLRRLLAPRDRKNPGLGHRKRAVAHPRCGSRRRRHHPRPVHLGVHRNAVVAFEPPSARWMRSADLPRRSAHGGTR